ncbi:response regulator [Spirochaeta cellobiosiphila]|uniref:response regulator n=1 Tax=Spirochaeta cellobiosiphila TaxID=504483 RepID=UPI0003FB3CB3|nr:response regulator [Spirochaeta cellobiosiphila]
MKIMCVDDSPSIRILVKKALDGQGYGLVEAENGLDAMDKLSTDISLFIVDINMPKMNGFEFVENLKQKPDYGQKPVVFLTTESSDDKKAKGKSLGVRGWIVKPFEPESLQKVVKMLLN